MILYHQRAFLSVEIMKRGLDVQMSSLPLKDLPDGLSAVLCGAGSPMPSENRSGPCIAVIAGETLFIVDAGDGISNLNRLGLPVGNIDTVFLTHFHSDHIDGLGQLAMNRWVTGNRSTPLPVSGPVGTKIVVEGFNQAYAQDAQYRNAHHGDSVAKLTGAGMVDGGGFTRVIDLTEATPGNTEVYVNGQYLVSGSGADGDYDVDYSDPGALNFQFNLQPDDVVVIKTTAEQ